MINRGATLLGRTAVIFAILFAFTACGGGGGGTAGFKPNNGGLSLSLFSPSGQGTDSITAAAPGTLRVNVDGAGSNVVATATITPPGLATIDPPSGTALTDNNGIATFRVLAGTGRGAGEINVSVSIDGNDFDESIGFQVGDTGLRLGYFDAQGTFIENQIFIEPESTLSSGGSAQLSVVILDEEGTRVTTAEIVTFNSGCIGAGLATINPLTPQTINGRASTLYTAAGCAGIDDITASTGGSTAQAFGTINVAAPQTTAVNFVSADPALIVLRGTGGGDRDEASAVTFTVIDGTGNPLQGVTVDFSLSTLAGGLSLSSDSALSNGDGQVQVTVQAGDVATVVRVIATVDLGNGEVISTVSDLLTVTTGLPDQNSISLSVGECEGESSFVVDGAMSIDGLCRTLTVAMADKFNNPVVDGTAAVFTTEYGSIAGSCETVGGTCSVEWRSQEPKFPTLTGDDFVNTIGDFDYDCPSHNGTFGACPDDLGYTRGGRSAILVHAIGEESFVDRNGNGTFDEGETGLFENLPEAFLDHNEDGLYTPALPECQASPMGSAQCIAGIEEIFIDFNGNDTYDFNETPAQYNGLLCPPEGDGVFCSRDLVHVRDNHVITLGAAPNFDILVERGGSVITSRDVPLRNGLIYTGHVADIFNNPPPAGSTISVTANDNCEILGQDSFVVPQYSTLRGNGAFSFPIQTNRDVADDTLGSVTIELSTPLSTYAETFSCDQRACDDFSPEPPGCAPVIP